MSETNKSKKIGRPTDSLKDKRIVVRLDDETLKILDDFCTENNLGRAEATRQAIRNIKARKSEYQRGYVEGMLSKNFLGT